MRDILFPPGIDKYAENYIAAMLMQLLHAPELEPFTLIYDDRYTYDIAGDSFNELLISPVQVSQQADSTCDMIPKY